MRLSLELVVIAIVLLVVALVVLTMFGGAFQKVGSLAEARKQCLNTGEQACKATGDYPVGWSTNNVGPNGETCAQLLPGCSCNPATKTWSCV